MTYKFEDMTAQDVVLIGQGLDFLPHGRVRALVDKLQAQITAQDVAAAKAAVLRAEIPASEDVSVVVPNKKRLSAKMAAKE